MTKKLGGPLPNRPCIDKGACRNCKQKGQLKKKDGPILEKKTQVKKNSPVQINEGAPRNEKVPDILL